MQIRKYLPSIKTIKQYMPSAQVTLKISIYSASILPRLIILVDMVKEGEFPSVTDLGKCGLIVNGEAIILNYCAQKILSSCIAIKNFVSESVHGFVDTEKRMDPQKKLSFGVNTHILKFLDIKTIAGKVSRVSKGWNNTAENPIFYQQLINETKIPYTPGENARKVYLQFIRKYQKPSRLEKFENSLQYSNILGLAGVGEGLLPLMHSRPSPMEEFAFRFGNVAMADNMRVERARKLLIAQELRDWSPVDNAIRDGGLFITRQVKKLSKENPEPERKEYKRI